MGKTAVITGTSKGFGIYLAKEFDANGWQVIGTGRSERPADFPKDATYGQFDASDLDECKSFWERISPEIMDSEICLINNAGGYISGSLAETSSEGYEQQMRSIYFSAVYMTKTFAHVVPKGRVINVISSSALAAHKNNSAYGAAKAAEMHFFQSLQAEFVPEQYQITNLYPSDIASRGANPKAIDPNDLSHFIRSLAESDNTIYIRDVTLYPRQKD